MVYALDTAILHSVKHTCNVFDHNLLEQANWLIACVKALAHPKEQAKHLSREVRESRRPEDEGQYTSHASVSDPSIRTDSDNAIRSISYGQKKA